MVDLRNNISMVNKEYKAIYLDGEGKEFTVFVASNTTRNAIDSVLEHYKNAVRVIRCCPYTTA